MPLEEYTNSLMQGYQFLDQHNRLLESLVISKQNASNSASIDQTSQGAPNVTEQPSQGIGQPSNQ